MASLREQFEHFYAPDDVAVATALQKGLVTPDTNALLNLYRFHPNAREDLFRALEKIGDRLWIPHQVALEFHRNRLKVIVDQESYFNKTGSELDSTFTIYLEKLKGFCGRIAMPHSDAQQLEQVIQKAHNAVKARILAAEQANEVHLDNRNSDPVLRQLENLFAGRVGEPMMPDELKTAKAEAKKRADDNVPPGYMDKGKSDPTGDYILWKQLMSEASTRKMPTVLVTDDRKEDWVWREHGQTIGPHFQLREEMMSVAGVSFMIMPTSAFLVHAKKYLNVSVSQATVDQAKEIPDSLEEHRHYLAMLRNEHINLWVEARRAMIEAQIRDTSERLVVMKKLVADVESDMNESYNQSGTVALSSREELERLRGMHAALQRERASLTHELKRLRDAREEDIDSPYPKQD